MLINKINLKFWAVLILIIFFSGSAEAARIKDLSGIKGVRSNQLIGFGLVIGLTKTGDSAVNVFFSIQAIASMLKKLGVTIPSGRIGQLQFKNGKASSNSQYKYRWACKMAKKTGNQ